jgi:hypothetical protein
MAKLDRSFQVACAPEEAQAMFIRDVAPALWRAAEFRVVHEEPGELHFSDARNTGFGYADPLIYDGLSHALARRITVQFVSDGAQTQVRISGHAERQIAEAVGHLGTPGHWPATANQPHD